MPRPPLFLEILVALGAGNLSVGPIHCEDESSYVEGYTVVGKGKGRGHVRIDPRRNVVDTRLHELTHRMRPSWSEQKVRAQTRLMMKDLTESELDTLYGLIQSVAVVKKRPVKIETD